MSGIKAYNHYLYITIRKTERADSVKLYLEGTDWAVCYICSFSPVSSTVMFSMALVYVCLPACTCVTEQNVRVHVRVQGRD